MIATNQDTSSPPLKVLGVWLKRGRQTLFEELSLSFHKGVTVILGANGAGKTTLLDALSAPQKLSAGTIQLKNVEVDQDSLPSYLAVTGYMPQSWSFFQGFSSLESVRYAAWLKRVSREEIDDRARRVLGDLGLGNRLDTKVSKLSGGMQQRVGLAETFVHDPMIAFLDEPTVGLDPEQRRVFRDFITEQGRTRVIVVSTHMTDDVETVADRVVIVGSTRVMFDGTVDELVAVGGLQSSRSRAIEVGYLRIVRGEL